MMSYIPTSAMPHAFADDHHATAQAAPRRSTAGFVVGAALAAGLATAILWPWLADQTREARRRS